MRAPPASWTAKLPGSSDRAEEVHDAGLHLLGCRRPKGVLRHPLLPARAADRRRVRGRLVGAARYTRREGIGLDTLVDILTWVAVGSLAGTRLVWVIGNWSELDSPAEAVMIWDGGMTLYGGILGGLVAGLSMLHRHRLPVLRMLDYAAPGLALGLIIGRASDLITGDHLGKPTGLPWGFRYVGTDPPGTAPPLGAVVHPVALYDLLLVSVLLVVLVLFLRRARPAGLAAALFAAYYSIDRLLLDFLRTDQTRLLGLTGTQLASIAALVVLAVWFGRWWWSRPPTTVQPEPAVPAGIHAAD